MRSHEVLAAAMHGEIPGIQLELERRGKRASVSLLYRYTQQSTDVNRRDPLEQCALLLESIAAVNWSGAWLLVSWLIARVMGTRPTRRRGCVIQQAHQEHADIWVSIANGRPRDEVGREILEANGANFALLSTLGGPVDVSTLARPLGDGYANTRAA